MFRFLVICSTLIAISVLAQEGSYKVIVHKDNPQTSLTSEEVSNFLLRKSVRWKNNLGADPVNLPGSSATRQAFSVAIHQRSVASIKNYWQRQIFAGRSVPPTELASEEAVIAYVESHPGAIGYVSAKTATGNGVVTVTISNE